MRKTGIHPDKMAMVIRLNCMNNLASDQRPQGFWRRFFQRIAMAVLVPILLSNGAGTMASQATPTQSRQAVLGQRLPVRLPLLPGLPAADTYLPTVEQLPTHVVLRLGQRRVYVYSDEIELASYPVAVGRSDTPTPTGDFQVFEMIENPVWQSPWTGEVHRSGADSALGLRWIGFARMPNGVIGFHGTPTVASIGHAASNGCVRLRNEHVLQLFSQVQIGMSVRVEP